jgi:hypothetical protein
LVERKTLSCGSVDGGAQRVAGVEFYLGRVAFVDAMVDRSDEEVVPETATRQGGVDVLARAHVVE